MRDEGTEFVLNGNIGFDQFLREVNRCVCLRQGWWVVTSPDKKIYLVDMTITC